MSDRTWLDFIPRLPGWILGCTGFVTTLVGFVELWRRGPGVVTAVLLATGVVAGSLGCAYLGFKRAPPLLGGEGAWQYPRVRPWALAGVWLLPVAALGGLGYYVYQQYRHAEKVVIVVADFDGEYPKKYRVTEIILEKLRRATEAYRDDVDVQPLSEIITTQGGSDLARVKGSERRASIVLWGWYAVTATSVRVTANFELLTKPTTFSPNQPTQSLTVAPSAIDSFTVQEDLSGQMSYLTLLSLGAARLDAQDYDKAIAFFTDAVNLVPAPEGMVDSGDIYALRGTAYIGKGDFDRALVEMDQALQRGGDRIRFYVTRGQAHLYKSDADSGLKDFDEAIDNALRNPHRDAKTNSTLATAYLGRGFSYLLRGDESSAREAFRNAIPLVRTDSPGDYVIRGMAYSFTGELEKAIADSSRSIELDPRDRCACAYLLRGQTYLEKGDARRGFADLARASRSAPRSPNPYLVRGVFLSQRGDHAAAIEDLSKAIQLSPNLGMAYAVRGLAYKEIGDDTNALADLTRAISLMPNYARGYLTRGQYYRERKNYDRAIADFTQAVTLDPGLGLGYVERAYAYLEKNQHDLAVADSTRAIQLRPPKHLSAAHVMRGRAHLARGALEAAIEDLSQAIELGPSLSAYSHRALAHKRKGDKERAISDLKNARRYTQDGSSGRRWVEEELKDLAVTAE
jgi:tetratricopeptide (TPR) repeat protein